MGLGDLVQKAVYLGIGMASYAGEKAGEKLGELRVQVQKLADEMVSRGEMTTEEARRFVDDMVNKAQQPVAPESTATSTQPAEPRQIEILVDDEEPTSAASPASATEPPRDDLDEMRRRVAELQEELRRLKHD
jgi:polyhydroxyalkanoate synthesis regulator phasin